MLEANKEMSRLIENFPSDLFEAIKIAKSNPLKKDYSNYSNILICGLGGSGIGGRIVASWFSEILNIPVQICQDYDIPKYVNSNTLLLASSYSGNTEETLSAVGQGHEKEATIIAVTSGGKLKEFCVENGYECITVPSGNPPRTQLAYSLVQLTHVLSELSLIDSKYLLEFENAANLLIENKTGIHKEAQLLSDFIHEKELFIYTDAKNEPIAIRARQQFNENSKILCCHHVIPEMNHNELLGWTGGGSKYGVLIIDTGDFNDKNYERLNFAKEFISTKTKHSFTLNAIGNTRIEKTLCLIHLIDWASLYYAINHNIDSVEINVIEDLKKYLQN